MWYHAGLTEFEPQWDKAPILKKEHKGLGKIVDIAYKEIR